jgi:uncharacterized protein YndB with AHSA1/START domain
MASIRHEIVIDASPERVWDVLRDVGAVHQRLLPGRVTDSRIEGDERFLTFPDGHVIRELIGAIEMKEAIEAAARGLAQAAD